MKQILLKKKYELILYTLLLLGVCLISFIQVEYNLTAPGYNNEVSDFITIEGAYEPEGTIHTTSVIVVREMSVLQKWIADNEPSARVSEVPQYYDYVDDLDDIEVMGYQMKDDSLANALLNALLLSEIDVEYRVEEVVYLIYNYMTPDTLEIGDIVVSINGKSVLEATEELNELACEETAEFNIIRDEEPMSFTLTKNYYNETLCGFGAFIDPLTTIESAGVEYEFNAGRTSGPSGGILQSLYIFNKLTPNDITGGLKIAGTGTIDAEGNIGRVGGINQKVITSAWNGIDIFFVPNLSDSDSDNYNQAVAALETINTDMVIVPIAEFSDAIDYLEARFGGAYDE